LFGNGANRGNAGFGHGCAPKSVGPKKENRDGLWSIKDAIWL
jgi:hypothetical protein